MRKLLTAGGLTLAAVSLQAQALELNFSAATNYWKPTPSGYVQGKKNEDKLDVKDNLGLSSQSATGFTLQLDHFIPVVPNLRLSHTPLEFTGQKNSNFTFLDTTFSGQLNTQVDLTHTDFTLYYRFLDGLTKLVPLIDLRAELGLTVRNFDGEFSVNDPVKGVSTSEQISLSTPVPLGYAGLDIGLPYGFSTSAKINAIGYSGNRLSDWTAKVRYMYDGLPIIKPGLEAGYRQFDVKLDDLKDTYGDLTFKGSYFGAYVQVGF